jgi:predicted O-methyltransferase YrrM
MDKRFIKGFLKLQAEIYRKGEKSKWKIPRGVDKKKGDMGLLPEDKDIGAWQVPPSSAMLLHFLSLSNGSKVILELGTSVGYSTVWLALTAKETKGHVYGTEFFKEKAQVAKANFKKIGLEKFITLYEENIVDVLKGWDKSKKIDFVFMDADSQHYHNYLDVLWPLLSPKGIIAVDNVGDFPHHMKAFLRKIARLKNTATYMLNIDHGILLIAKNQGTNLIPFLEDEFTRKHFR